MVYVKDDDNDQEKWRLCFGLPEVHDMNEFWFSVSAATGASNVFTYDVTELKIFSDLPNEKFTQFLENDSDYQVSGKDVIRKGDASSQEDDNQFTDANTLHATYLIQMDQKEKLK
jgi:hypothetical protein